MVSQEEHAIEELQDWEQGSKSIDDEHMQLFVQLPGEHTAPGVVFMQEEEAVRLLH